MEGKGGRNWNKPCKRILRNWKWGEKKRKEKGNSNWNLDSYHGKYDTELGVGPLFWGEGFLVFFFSASTYIAAFLGRGFELHRLGQHENSLDIDMRIFPTTGRPAQPFALQH